MIIQTRKSFYKDFENCENFIKQQNFESLKQLRFEIENIIGNIFYKLSMTKTITNIIDNIVEVCTTFKIVSDSECVTKLQKYFEENKI
jgi:hypothetical protein